MASIYRIQNILKCNITEQDYNIICSDFQSFAKEPERYTNNYNMIATILLYVEDVARYGYEVVNASDMVA